METQDNRIALINENMYRYPRMRISFLFKYGNPRKSGSPQKWKHCTGIPACESPSYSSMENQEIRAALINENMYRYPRMRKSFLCKHGNPRKSESPQKWKHCTGIPACKNPSYGVFKYGKPRKSDSPHKMKTCTVPVSPHAKILFM